MKMSTRERGPTTSLAKRGQIVGLESLCGNRRLSLKEISIATQIPLSTCSDIVRFSTLRMLETHIPDPCAEENLRPRPTSIKGQHQAPPQEEKARVIALALQDAVHCRKSLHDSELVSESGLQICSNTLSNVLSSDGIHHCFPTKKPFFTATAKAARLAWATRYRNFDFHKVLFTDESIFEASALHSAGAKGVLQRVGEEYRQQNLDCRFTKGTSAMFWGGIMYGYEGSQPPPYFFPTPIETPGQRQAAIIQLEQEFAMNTEDYEYFTSLGEPHTMTIPVSKTRSMKRRGGVDWYLYQEWILRAKIYPFLFPEMTN